MELAHSFDSAAKKWTRNKVLAMLLWGNNKEPEKKEEKKRAMGFEPTTSSQGNMS
ncbi:MAG: hypothetical protein ABH950_09150 [Candidatus Altiarchaeota archaeon]